MLSKLNALFRWSMEDRCGRNAQRDKMPEYLRLTIDRYMPNTPSERRDGSVANLPRRRQHLEAIRTRH
jgi:hypothetical protein